MKRTSLTVVALLAVSVGFAQDGGKSNPGSLYGNGADNPWVDRVARKPGDVLMIVIEEASNSSFQASTSASKTAGNTASIDLVQGFFHRLFGPLTTSGNGNSQGSGNTSYQSKMAARMSVMVKEVLPNGQMVIEGSRTLVTNKESQTYILSGLVRREDVKSDNTVDSTRIAEAEIRLESKGTIADRQRKGILTQLIDWLF